jgi:uncharacterized protein (TIGR03083 family)
MAELNYRQALVGQNDLLGDVFVGADWSTPVPTCPGWSLLQLLRHVGRGDRWAAEIVRAGDPGPDGGGIDPRQVAGGRPPDDEAGAIEWLHAGPVALLDAVSAAGPDSPVWTFVGPRPAKWWIRRRLHEATVHRADAALAIGRTYELDPILAADAISERLDLNGGLGMSPPSEEETSVVLRATDVDVDLPAWVLAGSADSAGAGVQLTGPSSELLLALFGRRSPQEAGLDISGDAGLWEQWLSKSTF